ncbi:MAG: hypothetical protein Athens041674_14 [Parcubacteria group bacterium Athens0416_74]|nr:MAG: hypothetical protein Athens041674_14 [Parcubacteria group bacterium Athens0416_74]
MLMSGLSYHNPEDMMTDSIILLFAHGVLIASIVGGWNLTHMQTNTWGRIVNWLCMLLPWICLALWIAGDYLYYQYIWPYYLYA